MFGKKFFRLFKPQSQYAVPRAEEDVSSSTFPKQGLLRSWDSPKFKIAKGGGIISDFMSSDIGGRLCSEKLKKIIEENKGADDLIQWLPVDIFNEETEENIRYYHIHFPEPPDCLSQEFSKWDSFGDVMVPVYLFLDIQKKEIFNSARGYERRLTVLSDHMLKAIEEAECTGLDLEPANVIYDEEKARQAAS